MTIVAGFHVQDGMLLVADSLYSGGIKIHQPKLFGYQLNPGTPDMCALAFALAGHEDFGKMAIEDCVEAVRNIPLEERDMTKFKSAMRTSIRTIHNEYVERSPRGERDAAKFDLIVAAWLPRAGGLWLFRSRGPAFLQVRDQYHCAGIGAYLGDYLMRPMFTPRMTVNQVALLAIQGFAAAKSYDQYCGGDTQFLRVNEGGQLTNVVPYDIQDSEVYVSLFERASRSLLFTVGDRTIDDAEFERKMANYASEVKSIRKMWKEGHPFQYQQFIQRLLEFRSAEAPPTPE
jgi:hypothetical protein